MPDESSAETEPWNARATSRLYAELDTVEGWLWVLVILTLTVDVYFTWLGLQVGLQEGNPIMDAAFEHVGFAVLGLVKGVVLGIAGFARELLPEYGPAIPLGLLVPWLVAVLINGTLLL